MKQTLKILGIVVGLLASSTLWAETTTISPEHPSLMRGTRPLGMGNAFLAMPGTDANAMFYNPASINDYEKKLHFDIMSLNFDFSTGAVGLVKDVFDFADEIDSKETEAEKITSFRTFRTAHAGQFESVSARLPLLTVMHKWFAVSLLADSRNTISFRDANAASFELRSNSDAGAMLGGAYGFFEDRLQVGLGLKVLHRISVDEVITENEIVNQANFDDIIPRNRATGVGVDLGLKYAVPTVNSGILEWLSPTVAMTWQDVGNTRFSGVVPDTNQSVSLGLALHHAFGPEDLEPKKRWNAHFAMDTRELNQSSTFPKKFYLGAELQAPQMLKFFRPSIRAGANQLYFAGGVTLDFRFAKLEFATYGEEAGKFSRQKQLRRIATNLSFGF